MNADLERLIDLAYEEIPVSLGPIARRAVAEVAVKSTISGLLQASEMRRRIFTEAIMEDEPPSSAYGRYLNALLEDA